MSTAEGLLNGLIIVITGGVALILFHPRMRRSATWQATVTPLASIIGSGFLVVAPLLGFTAGEFAVVAMAGIVSLAYLVGGAIRYNIRYVEDIVESNDRDTPLERVLEWLERLSKLALSLAYIIAVAFYLELLGAFVVRPFGIEGNVLPKCIATGLLMFIGGMGLWRGLRMLEGLEQYSVNIKLAIIAGFLMGLLYYNAELISAGQWQLPTLSTTWNLETLRKLLGAFLIVQGFETSRYLQGAYSPPKRIRTMRYAQLTAAFIYIVFVGLATVMFDIFHTISETKIIDLSRQVAWVLPFLLVVGAVMAQFSAAVADTVSSGGLVEEASRGRIGHRTTYLAAVGLAAVLLWLTHIFAIISYASRAFAAYYALQTAMAMINAWRREGGGGRQIWRGLLYLSLTLVMIATAFFGIPAETQSAGG